MRLHTRRVDAARGNLEPAGGQPRWRRRQQGGTEQSARKPGGQPGAIAVHAPISDGRRARVKHRGLALAILLAGCSLLAACSGAKVVYGQLDVLLPWYLRDYIDLDTGQRGQLQHSIDSLLAWHRESEVARYAAFFGELAAEATEPFAPGRLQAARLELDSFWDDIARQAAPAAATLLGTLSDAQVDELFQRIAREDRKVAKETLGRSDTERIERREKALRRQLERWVGRLDEDQRAMVAACAVELRADAEGWLASRVAWREALRQAFADRHTPTRFAPQLERLFADGESFWDPQYRERFEADRERVLRLLADVDRSLSPVQRSKMRERLERWALDLESIAGGA